MMGKLVIDRGAGMRGKATRALESALDSLRSDPGSYRPGSFYEAVRELDNLGCEHIAGALILALDPLPSSVSIVVRTCR